MRGFSARFTNWANTRWEHFRKPQVDHEWRRSTVSPLQPYHLGSQKITLHWICAKKYGICKSNDLKETLSFETGRLHLVLGCSWKACPRAKITGSGDKHWKRILYILCIYIHTHFFKKWEKKHQFWICLNWFLTTGVCPKMSYTRRLHGRIYLIILAIGGAPFSNKTNEP